MHKPDSFLVCLYDEASQNHYLLIFTDTLTKDDLNRRDNVSKEPKKDKSKRRRIVSDDDSNNEVKKNKSKRLRIGSDDSDEVVKKVKSKRLHVVSDDEIDDVVKKDRPKKSVVISDESDDDVMMANTESPDDLMVCGCKIGWCQRQAREGAGRERQRRKEKQTERNSARHCK